MNMTVRRFLQRTPVVRDLYGIARTKYQRRRLSKSARTYFTDPDRFLTAWDSEGGETVNVGTKDGLIFSIRQNHMDAVILAEIFLDDCYVRGLQLPALPVVVDIGGYIGDFAIYAVKRLNARRVVVCEPSPRNWLLLKQNIANNKYGDRVTAINKAVTTGEDVLMNVDAPDRNQATVSAYGPSVSRRTSVPGISLASLIESQGLRQIDLLKIDCEGGEYDILSTTPSEVLKNIQKIVFECHEIDGFQVKLEAVKQRLRNEGYILTVRASLVYASRP